MTSPVRTSAPPMSGTTNMGGFNYAFTQSAAPAAPPPFKKIAIIGGGSAGWMAAMIFANAMIKRGVEISVLESPAVGIIGVGEGSTPWLKGFFDNLVFCWRCCTVI